MKNSVSNILFQGIAQDVNSYFPHTVGMSSRMNTAVFSLTSAAIFAPFSLRSLYPQSKADNSRAISARLYAQNPTS